MKNSHCLLLPTLLLALQTLTGASTVTIDSDLRFQTWRGAGTCLAPWVPEYNALTEEAWFQKVYVEDLGMTILRVELMPDAHPAVAVADDIKYQNFNIDTGGGPHAQNERSRVFLNFGKAITALNPKSEVIGTAWSLPGWMKDSGSSLNGGAPKPEFYEHAGQWLLEWVKLYEAHGVNMSSISIANEPQFPQFYNSQVLNPEPYAALLKVVAERFARKGYGHIRFYGPEHMTLDQAMNINYLKAMKSAGSLQYLTAVAAHGYTDGVETDTNPNSASSFWRMVVKRFAPGKELWVTEGGTGGTGYSETLDQMAAMFHHGLVDGNVSLWTPWQVEGDFTSGGQHTSKSAIGRHYFGNMAPGAVRISASPSGADGTSLNVCAFAHLEEGTLSVMILNRTNTSQSLELKLTDDLGIDSWRSTRTTSAASQYKVMTSVPKPVDGSTTLAIPARSLTTLKAQGVNFDTAVFSAGWAYHRELGWTWAAERRSKVGFSLGLGHVYNGGGAWFYDYALGAWVYVQAGADSSQRWLYVGGLGWFYTSDAYGRYKWHQASASWYLDWTPVVS